MPDLVALKRRLFNFKDKQKTKGTKILNVIVQYVNACLNRHINFIHKNHTLTLHILVAYTTPLEPKPPLS